MGNGGSITLIQYVLSLKSSQDNQSLPLTCDIFVGPNCHVEYQIENGEVRIHVCVSVCVINSLLNVFHPSCSGGF